MGAGDRGPDNPNTLKKKHFSSFLKVIIKDHHFFIYQSEKKSFIQLRILLCLIKAYLTAYETFTREPFCKNI